MWNNIHILKIWLKQVLSTPRNWRPNDILHLIQCQCFIYHCDNWFKKSPALFQYFCYSWLLHMAYFNLHFNSYYPACVMKINKWKPHLNAVIWLEELSGTCHSRHTTEANRGDVPCNTSQHWNCRTKAYHRIGILGIIQHFLTER